MHALPSFSLDEIEEVDEEVEGFVRPARAQEAVEAAGRRSRVHCVRWSGHSGLVVMKEVHLWAEDTVRCDVHTIADRIGYLQSSTDGKASARCFVRYLALHVDTDHHYQWLLQLCGPSLKAMLDASSTQPCFSEAKCKPLLRCILVALHHLHSVCAWVHGDVSLGNIVITNSTTDKANSGAALCDLETLTSIGAEPSGSPGTLLYAAPERLQTSSHPVSAADDVWAFGIVAYQLLTGCSKGHPWYTTGSTTAMGPQNNFWLFLDAMTAVQNIPPLDYLQQSALASSAPAAMHFISACLAWEPSERPTAAALLQLSWLTT